MTTPRAVEGVLHKTMLSHRIQGLLLMAVVFVVVLVVLTIVQAVEGDWFIYSAFSDTVSGTMKNTEWGMVGLGVILGAGFALIMGFLCHLLSEYWHRGQRNKSVGYYADIETGKEKFLAAQHSPTERDYVARYGQKAYRSASGVQAGSMPQPLTPGHTAVVKIKALTEQEAAAPGRGWSLGRLLSFSWDPAAKAAAEQYHVPPNTPSRLGASSLAKTESSSSSIQPVQEDRDREKAPATRALTFSEIAHQISSPFGFLRAGTAQPVAYDTPYEGEDAEEPPSTPYSPHQGAGGQPGSPHRGAGLMYPMYSRKLEQAHQLVVQMQAAKARLGAEEGPGAQLGPSPRILVLRESGDVEVDVNLGDRENSPDGSFARTTTHRRISIGSASDEEQEAAADGKASKHLPAHQKGQVVSDNRDGHAPEVVPADGDSRSTASKADRRATKASKSFSKSDAAHNALPAKSKEGFGSSNSLASDAYRRSASPVFLSPATSLNSNSSSTALSSGGSDSLGQQPAGSRDADSIADAVAAAAVSNSTSGHAVKDSTAAVRQATPAATAATAEKLSSAALKKMDGGKGGKRSAKSVKSHSRSSSVEWQDVELQSEAEDDRQHDRQREGHKGKAVGGSQKAAPPTDRAVAASAAGEYAESDNESELGISEVESHERSAEHTTMPAEGATALSIVPLTALPQEAAAVKMVVCMSLEEILPRPKAGLLSRMLRLADVNLVASQHSQEPVYLLHPGGEYHIRVSLFHPPSGQRVQVQGVDWIRVGVADGQAVTLDVEAEQDAAGGEDTWRATWMTSQHESQVLTTGLSEDAQEEQTLDLTIGLKRKDLGKQSRRGRKHRSNPQAVVVTTSLAAKIVTRASDAPTSHNASEEYSPPAHLLDLWRKWHQLPEDIQDCTVICTK